MANLLDALTDTSQFNSNSFSNDDLQKKILSNGNNRFRITGNIKVFYVHKFDAANGVRVSSVCTKDENGVGECDVCKEYKDAWAIINKAEKELKDGLQPTITMQEMMKAEIKVGRRDNPIVGFKQSWGAKRFCLFNIIDRDSNINKETNHTSLLCKSEYDLGISAGQKSIYEVIVKLITKKRQEIKANIDAGLDYLPFDIDLIRSGKGIDTEYEKESSNSYDLTEEEKAYEKYNLDDLVKPTPDNIVKTWLTTGTKSAPKQPNEQAQSEQPKQEQAQQTKQDNTHWGNSDKTQQAETTQQETTQQNVWGNDKQEQPKTETTQEQSSDDVEKDHCPTCNKLIPVTTAKCPFCGEEFESYGPESSPY